jgi:hypothetical protein
MIWLFLLALTSIFVFIKLGMYSVWVSVLAISLKVACAVIIALGGVFGWRKFSKGK